LKINHLVDEFHLVDFTSLKAATWLLFDLRQIDKAVLDLFVIFQTQEKQGGRSECRPTGAGKSNPCFAFVSLCIPLTGLIIKAVLSKSSAFSFVSLFVSRTPEKGAKRGQTSLFCQEFE
jgi:hypothetical protein